MWSSKATLAGVECCPNMALLLRTQGSLRCNFIWLCTVSCRHILDIHMFHDNCSEHSLTIKHDFSPKHFVRKEYIYVFLFDYLTMSSFKINSHLTVSFHFTFFFLFVVSSYLSSHCADKTILAGGQKICTLNFNRLLFLPPYDLFR